MKLLATDDIQLTVGAAGQSVVLVAYLPIDEHQQCGGIGVGEECGSGLPSPSKG